MNSCHKVEIHTLCGDAAKKYIKENWKKDYKQIRRNRKLKQLIHEVRELRKWQKHQQ